MYDYIECQRTIVCKYLILYNKVLYIKKNISDAIFDIITVVFKMRLKLQSMAKNVFRQLVYIASGTT